MAVTKEFFFPDTPAAGDNVELVPLAGNGYTAPHSYYAFDIQADGDATGGSLIVQIRFDERYTSIMPYVMDRTNSIAANVTIQFLLASTNVDLLVEDGVLVFSASLPSDFTWEPPPLIIQGQPRQASGLTFPYIRLETANVDSEDHQVFGRVYNFKIDALKHVALPVLLSVLPR